jgi:hypothetical protein
VDVVARGQPFEERGAMFGIPVRLADRLTRRLDRAGERPEVRLVRVEPRDPLQAESSSARRRRRVGRVREEPRVIEARSSRS